ncbi:FAST kinase domain-containing protein 4 [Musca vetustissima]|uniref:FAST kinase domain-containing protein 4 n=1 Tax=Musca vetustissima TaxID=27455 RepID=UPI002AB7D0A4|nr:FAST kinase domain-containing protein 4 [Musca vetustissima]
MMGLRFYTTTASHLFRRAAFGNASVMRSSSNVAAVEAASGATKQMTTTSAAGAGKESGETTKATDDVAAAFENLQKDESQSSPKTSTSTSPKGASVDERITNAKTINGLLGITEGGTVLTRKHALRIVSILSEWSSINRVKLNEFENDPRFLKVCRMLGRTVPKNGNGDKASGDNAQKRISGFRTDDLNTVLGVAGDDEAAKLIASISLPQMVKVMSTLAARKRRSTPLLRSLAFNISSSTEHLDLKQCGDVFYAMATLNFQDSVLAAKLCADIQVALPKNTDKSAVIGSILTSLGILKYRDLDILESLTQWTIKHSDICRPQDLSALFLTSAMLNFKSTNLEEVQQKLAKTIVQQDFSKSSDWLNHVWAMTILGLSTNQQLESVLSKSFAEKIQSEKTGLNATSKMKLLNLNSYAQMMATDYKGELIPADSVIYNVPMAHAKGKQVLVNGLLDALKSLLPSQNHVSSLVDSKMGFLIDAMCVFDNKRNPLPLDKTHKDAIKVALMVVDYHDICHGTHKSATGITTLSFDLLEKSGYKVIPIPYNEFNTSDKLLKRVQYLESKFKALIK